MATGFYGSDVCRQFNMLGSYISYYELADITNIAAAPSSHMLPSDCLAHVQEPTKGCGSESPSEASASEESDSGDETGTHRTAVAFSSTNEEELICKLKEAENTISALQDHFERINRDYFDLEQALKKTYYKDCQRSQLECSRLQNELEDKDQQLLELSRRQEITKRFWDDRQREIHGLMNDVILNVKDMCRYQELCNLFSPE
ncbi:uncharacterized protein BXIN_2732 [Babesia sp. Xinjiang]|uniref:uncharacterized protein n=1 Tax=Babesia sp. Xinjiang TaxID=462227 RepID=UPI000A251780|nr:uncharacterized protein BXIN_2732 [Babesia sp. Xinjiang]ORM41686.1 hypothetical protein BXIN_2732 [Babesia sp. Xinjiang]